MIGYGEGEESDQVSTEYCTIGSQPGMDGWVCDVIVYVLYGRTSGSVRRRTRKSALLRIVVIIIVNFALQSPEEKLVVPGLGEVTVLRLREHRFCIVIGNALESCTVVCGNFACTFYGTSAIPYGQGVLRLAVRLPLVTCVPQFYVFAQRLCVVLSIECGGLEDGCNEGKDTSSTITALLQ